MTPVFITLAIIYRSAVISSQTWMTAFLLCSTQGEILNKVLVTHLEFSLHIIDPVPSLLDVKID